MLQLNKHLLYYQKILYFVFVRKGKVDNLMKSSPKNNLALFNRGMIDATTDERASVKLVHSKHGWLASMKKYGILFSNWNACILCNERFRS